MATALARYVTLRPPAYLLHSVYHFSLPAVQVIGVLVAGDIVNGKTTIPYLATQAYKEGYAAVFNYDSRRSVISYLAKVWTFTYGIGLNPAWLWVRMRPLGPSRTSGSQSSSTQY